MFTRHPLGIAGAADRGVVANDRAAIKIVDAGVHQHHAVLATGLDERFKHMLVVLADYIPNGAGSDQQFVSEDARAAIDTWEKVLGDDALECVRELENNLALGAAFENADDPFESVGDVG